MNKIEDTERKKVIKAIEAFVLILAIGLAIIILGIIIK